MARYDSVLGTIGNTPLVDVSELCPNPRVQVLVKLEGLNPAGSVKDRAAKSMIEEAEKNGSLVPGQRILESSSGNTAAGLAMIAKIKGYPFTAVVPENVSVERTKLLTAFGAEIIVSPASEGSNGAMRRAQALAQEHPEWWFSFQYGNPANPKAHYEGTGPEILAGLPGGHPLRGRTGHGGHHHRGRPFPKGAQTVCCRVGRPAAHGGEGRGAEKPGRGLRPPRVHRQRRVLAARPQPGRRAEGEHRVGPAPGRGRHFRRAFDGGGHGRRGPLRLRDR